MLANETSSRRREQAVTWCLTKSFKSLILICISVAVGLAGAELIVRAYSVMGGELGQRLQNYDFNPSNMPVESYSEDGYRQKPNAIFRYRNGTSANANAQGFRGPVVSDTKPQGTFRIILLGGSTTHGWNVNDDQTIDAYLRQALAKKFPSVNIEVVNLAFDGYDSYQLYLRMRSDGLRFRPDLVIVNEGVNDVRNAHITDLKYPDTRTNGWFEVLASMKQEGTDGPNMWTLAKHYSYLVRVAAFVRHLNYERQVRTKQRTLVKPNPWAVDYFETSLRGIGGLARGIGASIIFSTPPSSLQTRYRPTDTSDISYWVVDAATTQSFRDSLAQRMRLVAADLNGPDHRVNYVSHNVPPEGFMDDCHLTSNGNQIVANNLALAATPFIESAFDGSVTQ